MVAIHRIERVIRIVLIDRVGWIAGIVPVHGIERAVRIVFVDRIERIIRLILIHGVEDIVVPFVAFIESACERTGIAQDREENGRHDPHVAPPFGDPELS